VVTLDGLAVGVLCAALVWAPVVGGAAGIWLVPIAQLLVLLGMALWVLSLVRDGRLEWRRTTLNLPLALLVVLVLVQLALGNRPVARWVLAPPSAGNDLPTPLLSLGTVSPERTLGGLLIFLTYLGVYALVVNLVRGRRQLDRFVQGLLLLGGLVGFLGLLDYFVGPAWLRGWRQGGGRLVWTFVNPDHFAAWLGMLICLGLGYQAARARGTGPRPGFFQLLRSREGRERAIRRHLPVVAIVVMGLALLFTLSRGGAVSVLVGLAGLLSLLGVLGWTRRIVIVMGLGLAAALSYAAWIGLSPLLQRVWHADYGIRWLVSVTSMPMLAAAPVLGVGLGAYPDLYPRYQPAAFNPSTLYVNAAHNDLLQLVIELGFVGAALCLWGAWRVGRDLVGAHLFGLGSCPVGGKASARRSDPFSVGIAAGALGGVLVLLVHSLVDFPARIAANGMVAAALLGIATVALHTRFGADGDRPLDRMRQLGAGRRWARPPVVSLVVLAVTLGATAVILRPPVVAAILRSHSESPSPRQVERALTLDPGNVPALETRARARLATAQRAWNSGLSDGGRVLASWDERRREAGPLLLGAVADLRAAILRRPSDASLHQQLALVYEASAVTADPATRSEQLEAAVAHFKRAIFLAPADPSRHRALAAFAARQGGPVLDHGLDAARGAVARDRSLVSPLVDDFLETGLRESQWLAIVPATAIDRLLLGAALEARGLSAPAARAYRSAAEVASPDEASLVSWLLADLLSRQGDHRSAAVELETALRRDPANPELRLAWARTLEAQGNPAALEAYRAAIVSAEAIGTNARARRVVGEELPFSVAALEARGLVRERVGPGQGVARYYRALAEYLTARKDWRQAVAAWDLIVRTAPRDPVAHFRRGVALDGLGKRDEALEAYRQAVSLDSSSVAYRLRLAERLWQADQYVQAMNEWQGIIAQRPGNVEARLALAAAYVRIGNPTEASREYSRVLQMVPGHAEAQRGLANLGRPTKP
jgi:tetratricopeptide (TPR) repeat protein